MTPQQLKEKFSDLGIVSDTGWVYSERTSNARRGLLDYFREIVVSSELAKQDQLKIAECLQKNDCPGWTPITVRSFLFVDSKTYVFHTTMDSSD